MTKKPWRRYRFKTDSEDYRPVKFPPPGPYWCTGYGDEYSVIVAYLPSDEELTEYWPEAFDVDYTEENEIVFTDRFKRPRWWLGGVSGDDES